MTNEERLTASSSAARGAYKSELSALLAERAARYTMGDSLSVTRETAKRLADSAVYAIELHKKLRPADGSLPVKALYEAGVADARRLCARGKLLLAQAARHAPKIENAAYAETFSELIAFFKRYDADFFPAEIPCSIDYPLCRPVPEALCGVEYVNGYLRRLCVENEFLEKFPADAVRARLASAVHYDAELVVNLVSPVLDAAVGCALANCCVRALAVPANMQKNLLAQFRGLDEKASLRLLEQAACRVFDALRIESETARSYLGLSALDLLPRLTAAVKAGDLGGIF